MALEVNLISAQIQPQPKQEHRGQHLHKAQRKKGNTVCTCRLFYILDSCVFKQEALSRMPRHQNVARDFYKWQREAYKKAISDLRHHVCKITKPPVKACFFKTKKNTKSFNLMTMTK